MCNTMNGNETPTNRIIGFHVIVLVLLSVPLSTGISCQWMQVEFGDPEVEGHRMPGRQFGDIPAPKDSQFKKEHSYSTTLPGKARVARLVYISEHSREYLETFYQRRMTNYNWTPSDYNLENQGVLQFYSDHEIAEVKIQERENGTSKIQIDIDRRQTAS